VTRTGTGRVIQLDMSLLNSLQTRRMSLGSSYLPFHFTNVPQVNACSYLASGLQVLGALSALTALYSFLSFAFGTFLRPGVSVRSQSNPSFLSPMANVHPSQR
jgi:uncharacterized membrane protein